MHPNSAQRLLAVVLALTAFSPAQADTTKEQTITSSVLNAPQTSTANSNDEGPGGGGYRFEISNDAAHVPVVVVGGTPYQRGWHLGRLMRPEIQRFIPAVVAGFKAELKVPEETLDQVWATTAAFTDDRLEQELVGLAEGSGLPLRTLQHVHCLPLLMPYSCSSLAAWGTATEDGHLYQTRNLDWSLEAGAHDFPVLLVELPNQGTPHVLPTFAGVIGANCGLNAAGVVLSEMGDSPAKEMPYNVQAPHFTSWFRTILYDAGGLSDALEIFRRQPATKRYHFVFGDGRREVRSVKILAHSVGQAEERLRIWRDNDPTDELAPKVMPNVVYQDEGRGAFEPLREQCGKLNAEKMIAIANRIPIKGGNVLNVVFDATALRLWVSYASGKQEAYLRPSVFLDWRCLDRDGDGRSDLEEGGSDRDHNHRPDFLDPQRSGQ